MGRVAMRVLIPMQVKNPAMNQVGGKTAPATEESESEGESSDLTSDASSDGVRWFLRRHPLILEVLRASASQASDADAAGDGTSPSSTGSEARGDSSAEGARQVKDAHERQRFSGDVHLIGEQRVEPSMKPQNTGETQSDPPQRCNEYSANGQRE